MNAVSLPSADLVPAGLIRRSDVEHNAEFDITAMIDLVFMMNIYFLVTFIGAAMQEVNLPAADHCAPLDAEVATIITVLAGPDAQSVVVRVGEGEAAVPLADPDQQAERIGDAVEQGAAQGKTKVLIKAEKGIRLREMGRLAAAASREGVTLHLAVMEKDVAP